MKPIILLLLTLTSLITSSCEFNQATGTQFNNPNSNHMTAATNNPTKNTTTTNSSKDSSFSTNSQEVSTSIASGSDSFHSPQSGIISDPIEWSAGNPKSHPKYPVARDLTLLADNTREEDEAYRTVFEDYLKHHYPEYQFRVVNITNFQEDGTSYKKAQAYAAESIDTSMFLYFNGHDIYDSFQNDVILRQNTLNRWRLAFREYLDPLTFEIVPLMTMNLDVSYSPFQDNIAKVHLDEPFSPTATIYQRALNLYIQRDHLSSEETANLAVELLTAVEALDYSFDEYFLHRQSESGHYTLYQIPQRLINSPALGYELEKILRDPAFDSPIKLIQP